MSRRHFSTSAVLKKLLKWKLNGTTEEISWVKTSVESRIDHVPALAKKATKAIIEGNPHETRQRDGTIDPYHASGIILSKSDRRLTLFYVYENGLVRFSKDKYNVGDDDVGESSRATSAFKTGMTWQMNSDNTCALWWDGSKWQEGQWSKEYAKWTAFWNGEWYAWE
ncbi:hypothetical protein MGU_05919 [Metarhizium guizhouense ARSEF 977]|uniref:Uncharacterized protein n=1 Tax=Metarhizium guizhouense (strain ARSEF 977) TaxID=1276136 RepID=A0A0B4HBF6_METGA|nr:hypothetical protein MGU_05919 [Metarhizium guizhouense ARSEF 977]